MFARGLVNQISFPTIIDLPTYFSTTFIQITFLQSALREEFYDNRHTICCPLAQYKASPNKSCPRCSISPHTHSNSQPTPKRDCRANICKNQHQVAGPTCTNTQWRHCYREDSMHNAAHYKGMASSRQEQTADLQLATTSWVMVPSKYVVPPDPRESAGSTTNAADRSAAFPQMTSPTRFVDGAFSTTNS